MQSILPKIIGFTLNVLSLILPKKAAQKAFDLFVTPRKGRVKSHQNDFLSNFKKQVISSDDGDVMTYDDGRSGIGILLCHGWESNSSRWKKLYTYLSNVNCNIIMMDAPAHGNTSGMKFDALKYVNMMDSVCGMYKPKIIISHSVGGYSSLIFAADRKPKSLEHLIVLAPADKLVDITNRYFDMMSYWPRLRKYYDALIKTKFGEDISYYSASKFAKSLQISGLIIHDKEDNVNLFYESEAIHESWAASQFIPTIGFGHSLQNEEVYSHISHYIQKANN